MDAHQLAPLVLPSIINVANNCRLLRGIKKILPIKRKRALLMELTMLLLLLLLMEMLMLLLLVVMMVVLLLLLLLMLLLLLLLSLYLFENLLQLLILTNHSSVFPLQILNILLLPLPRTLSRFFIANLSSNLSQDSFLTFAQRSGLASHWKICITLLNQQPLLLISQHIVCNMATPAHFVLLHTCRWCYVALILWLSSVAFWHII